MSQRARTNTGDRSAWDNHLEILLFWLGTPASGRAPQTYGINVLKVREVARTPHIAQAPGMPLAIEGMVALRGGLVAAVNLAAYIGMAIDSVPQTMIVAEYNGQVQGLLVEGVDRIVRVPWSSVRKPPVLLTHEGHCPVTAVAELPDGRLVMMLDVEQLLPNTKPEENESSAELSPVGDRTVLLVDDSPYSRKHTAAMLRGLRVRHVDAGSGAEAWQELQIAADAAEAKGLRTSDQIQAVVSDVEMPEMDGFMLTRRIKSDPRFAGIPVVLHSSLSGVHIQKLALRAGADDYVSKSQPQQLAQTLRRLCADIAKGERT